MQKGTVLFGTVNPENNCTLSEIISTFATRLIAKSGVAFDGTATNLTAATKMVPPGAKGSCKKVSKNL